MESQSAVVVDSLVVRRGGRRALDAISFSCDRTGPTVLLGPNGAGKTTLIETLLGRLSPEAGSTTVLGLSPKREHRAVLRSIGWMPQDARVDRSLRVGDLVAYAGWLKGMSWPAAHEAALTALALVDLSERERDRVGSLSGGQARRLVFAASVVHRPAILLLDEPMNGLDPAQRRDIRRIIRIYAEDACVVVATHILQDVPEIGGRMVILDKGSAAYVDTVESFVRDSRSENMSDLEDAYLRKLDPLR